METVTYDLAGRDGHMERRSDGCGDWMWTDDVKHLIELLSQVAGSPVEFDWGKYVTVQIDRELWKSLAHYRTREEKPCP
jgi:hypothetical protein